MPLLVLVQLGSVRGATNQSVLEPSGPLANRVASLWWFALVTASIVWLATLGSLWWAASRARRRERQGEELPADGERRMTRGVTIAVSATVVILLVFLVTDLSVGRTLDPVPRAHPLTIELTGKQWWWDVTYADTSPSGRFKTANEIHIPVGQPVLFVLNARDVIHSFWVPNLAGKKDLIPGYTQSMWFQADTAGDYRAQCAEFCGLQHAKMALHVIAEAPADYERWVAAQRAPGKTPVDSVTDRGREVFVTGPCAMCHNVTGTSASATNGPDLTHLASRRTIAAGTLPNTRGALAGWIVDPQRVKPGAKMPPNQLSTSDLDAQLTYLQSLK
jgi:cytochrome c oxidase subunit 2